MRISTTFSHPVALFLSVFVYIFVLTHRIIWNLGALTGLVILFDNSIFDRLKTRSNPPFTILTIIIPLLILLYLAKGNFEHVICLFFLFVSIIKIDLFVFFDLSYLHVCIFRKIYTLM